MPSAKFPPRLAAQIRENGGSGMRREAGMKTLGVPKYREEIASRLGLAGIDSRRRWGKMTAHQMVCHLGDSFRGVIGEKALAGKPATFTQGLMKWGALYVPLRWPHGIKTMPEMDQEIGGTRPVEFDGDVRELRRLLERFTRQPRDFSWRPHPIFGEMTEKDWMRWGYLHMDHHFRQFGV
jgi:uncharacterized protein DUF1569